MDKISYVERIEALKTRGAQYSNTRELLTLITTNYSFKQEIGVLYSEILNKRVNGCNNCYADAFFELINLLKKEGMETKIEKKFVIMRGVLLHDKVNLDATKMLSYTNMTAELALYHLATNPDCIKYFSQLPDDWKTQVEEYKKNMLIHDIYNTGRNEENKNDHKVEAENKLTPKQRKIKDK